ncbi:MAG: OmpH family outer membrane protein [Prevotellaceae bacterium]|jgi:outer membrane protein|nr:OmpH family outer membrane protein [Prevotellaceae bacterium]
MKKIILCAALVAAACGANAQQTYKFGHINGQEVLALMPERDSAEAKYMAYGKDLEEMIEVMQVEYNKMLQEYQQKARTWSEAIRETKEKDLQDKGQRIQEFQVTAREDLQKRQMDLLRPVIEKATNAVKKVGKDNGFTYIYDVSNAALAYWDTEQSIDITELVRKELNIPANKTLPKAAATSAR